MTLAEFKSQLTNLSELQFQLPNGQRVPAHFHITEVGHLSKNFIDCGGTVRTHNSVNFQLWMANDFEHRLSPEKLVGIIRKSEKHLSLDENWEITVEYQGHTIELYGLSFSNGVFQLKGMQTECLALEACNIDASTMKSAAETISKEDNCCTPGSGCC